MLKLKVKPVVTALGTLGGAAIGYALARKTGMTLQDASAFLNALPYVSGIPCFAALGGITGYAIDKIRERKKYPTE